VHPPPPLGRPKKETHLKEPPNPNISIKKRHLHCGTRRCSRKPGATLLRKTTPQDQCRQKNQNNRKENAVPTSQAKLSEEKK